MSRTAFSPTPEQRKTVEAMAAYGVPHEQIGVVVGISAVTLRKYFESELETGAIRANAKVAETCYRMATSGDNPAATFFWLKTRAGWKETHVNEIAGRDGGPVTLEVNFVEGASEG